MNPTCISHLWPPKPITVAGPSLGDATPNIYCLEIFWSEQPLANGEASQEEDWGVVIGQATGDSTLSAIPERTRWAILHIFDSCNEQGSSVLIKCLRN